jgi:ComF family protein
VAEGLFATIFPGNCRFCSAPLVNLSRVPVCDACLDSIRALEDPVCQLCGDRLLAAVGEYSEGRCGECLRVAPLFAKASAYGAYQGALRDLIHLLKYQGVRPAANLLGRMAGEILLSFAPGFGPEPPLVIPVPLFPLKMRSRGFNQAELIARVALRQSGVGAELRPELLERTRLTESQTGLSRAQRRRNLQGAFSVAAPQVVSGRDVLLVDDVFTTGTTVSECARVLLRAGAARIWVATVARVLRSADTFSFFETGMEDAEDDSAPQTLAAHV